MPTETRLHRLAVRAVATAPGLLLATRLAEYDDATLAAQLGCDPAAVGRLRLCRPPRPECWAADVAAIAQHVRCDPAGLDALLRAPSR